MNKKFLITKINTFAILFSLFDINIVNIVSDRRMGSWRKQCCQPSREALRSTRRPSTVHEQAWGVSPYMAHVYFKTPRHPEPTRTKFRIQGEKQDSNRNWLDALDV